jgi:hypothetical protein
MILKDVSTIAVTINFLCRGRRREDGFEGLENHNE